MHINTWEILLNKMQILLDGTYESAFLASSQVIPGLPVRVPPLNREALNPLPVSVFYSSTSLPPFFASFPTFSIQDPLIGAGAGKSAAMRQTFVRFSRQCGFMLHLGVKQAVSAPRKCDPLGRSCSLKDLACVIKSQASLRVLRSAGALLGLQLTKYTQRLEEGGHYPTDFLPFPALSQDHF